MIQESRGSIQLRFRVSEWFWEWFRNSESLLNWPPESRNRFRNGSIELLTESYSQIVVIENESRNHSRNHSQNHSQNRFRNRNWIEPQNSRHKCCSWGFTFSSSLSLLSLLLNLLCLCSRCGTGTCGCGCRTSGRAGSAWCPTSPGPTTSGARDSTFTPTSRWSLTKMMQILS